MYFLCQIKKIAAGKVSRETRHEIKHPLSSHLFSLAQHWSPTSMMGTSGTEGNTGPPCFQDFASPCDLLTDHTPSHTSMMGSSGTGGNTAPPCSQDFASPCDFSTDHIPSHNHVTQPDKQGFITRNWQQSRCPIFYPSRHAFPITPPSTPSVILQFLLSHPSIFTRPQ